MSKRLIIFTSFCLYFVTCAVFAQSFLGFGSKSSQAKRSATNSAGSGNQVLSASDFQNMVQSMNNQSKTNLTNQVAKEHASKNLTAPVYPSSTGSSSTYTAPNVGQNSVYTATPSNNVNSGSSRSYQPYSGYNSGTRSNSNSTNTSSGSSGGWNIKY